MQKFSRQSGFTLVELAVVLVITGVIMGSTMALFTPYLQRSQLTTTRDAQANIAKSLALFAQNYGRLPCPADPNPVTEPFGAPRQSGSQGINIAQNNCGNTNAGYIGIVPFRALGLTEDQVRDGFDNFITYAVSQSMTEYNAANVSSISTIALASSCLSSSWYDAGTHKNIRKANVCCPKQNVGANNVIMLDKRVLGSPLLGVDAGDLNKLVAYTLVSHGKDGDGAFMKGTASTMPVTVSATTEELENRNGDMNFVDKPITMTNDATYFDDIVFWQTNAQIMSTFNDSSCARP